MQNAPASRGVVARSGPARLFRGHKRRLLGGDARGAERLDPQIERAVAHQHMDDAALGELAEEKFLHGGSTVGGFAGMAAGAIVGGAVGAVYGLIR